MQYPLRFVVAAILSALPAFPAPAADPPRKVELSKGEQTLLDLVNAAREKNRLPPLTPHPTLMTLARDHSANMLRQEKMSHTLDGKTAADRAKEAGYNAANGENIASGQGLSPAGAFDVWKDSPPHWANILGEGYREIGIGGASVRNGPAYYTLVFGAGGAGVATPATPRTEDAGIVALRKAMLDEVNAARAKEKAPALRLNPRLTAAAQGHAANMAKQDKLTHTLDGKAGPDRVKEAGYRGEYGGQLIASFEDAEVKEVVKAWLAKKEQAARLLNDELKDVGVGVAKDGNGGYWHCLAFGGGEASEPTDDAKYFKEIADTVLALTNAARKEKGLAQLNANERLGQIGRGHSANMAKQGKMEHVLDGKAPKDRVLESGYDYAAVGENLARTDGDRPETIFKLWMESKEHRTQILNPDFREMGLGLVRDDKGRIWYTQLFGTQRKK
jgi:uncharacterized protein YkwD